MRTDRSRVRRLPQRGAHDEKDVHSILDSGYLAHVGFEVDSQPFVIPTLYGREGEKLYLHGSAASRMMRRLERGFAACISVTLVDGLVLARSAFNHSMNYRSVVAFGRAQSVQGEALKSRALRIISEHLLPGRWDDVRMPTTKELKATSVLEFAIEEASVKLRSGAPIDDELDYELPVWAGVIPVVSEMRDALPDPKLRKSTEVPDYIGAYIAQSRSLSERCNVTPSPNPGNRGAIREATR